MDLWWNNTERPNSPMSANWVRENKLCFVTTGSLVERAKSYPTFQLSTSAEPEIQ